MSTTRIDARFAECAAKGRPALVTFITAGDPTLDVSEKILVGLPEAGADVIELGMPFSDPMADGPAVQLAGQRALANGHKMADTLALVEAFRKVDNQTPIVLMGYYNPVYIYGVERFLADAKKAGVDGFIIVDLPAEEDAEMCLPTLAAGLNFVRLATPTTNDKRLKTVLKNTSGFVYYVSVTGITGAAIKSHAAVGDAVRRIKTHTELPVVVGFGIKTAEDAALIGRDADGVVVGSAVVNAVANSLENGKPTPQTPEAVLALVRDLAKGIRRARS